MSYDPNTNFMLDLDLTGTNPDNLVENELHSLSNRGYRSVAPKLGPFFGDSLRIHDGGTPLVRGQDYQLIELHQETTLKTGKEIYSVILIISSGVSPTVTITYQALGGYYGLTGSNETIARMYEVFKNDTRGVDWEQIFNKPSQFTPTNHRHLLEDVYGFEPVVDYLERIKRAITIGQAGVLKEAMEAMLGKFPCRELPKILPSSKALQYDALLYFLSKRKILSKLVIDTYDCSWRRGSSVKFYIDTTGVEPGKVLYWELYKEGGGPICSVTDNKGEVVSNGGIVDVIIYVPTFSGNGENKLYLGVKEDKEAEEFCAVSYVIDLLEPAITTDMLGYMTYTPFDLNLYTRRPFEYHSDNARTIFYMSRVH